MKNLNQQQNWQQRSRKVAMSKKFYQSQEFKSLQMEWRSRLKRSGFKDLEDEKERLFQPETRILGLRQMEAIRNFFLDLDCYLTTHELPSLHRTILELYSQGIPVKGPRGIANKVDKCDTRVRDIIRKYKKLILSK